MNANESKKVICWVRWGDAMHSMAEHALADIGDLAVLEEVGFLCKESDESLTIATESQDDALSVRFWLTIPKHNIIEIRRTTVGKAFKNSKPRVRKLKKPKADPATPEESTT